VTFIRGRLFVPLHHPIPIPLAHEKMPTIVHPETVEGFLDEIDVQHIIHDHWGFLPNAAKRSIPGIVGLITEVSTWKPVFEALFDASEWFSPVTLILRRLAGIFSARCITNNAFFPEGRYRLTVGSLYFLTFHDIS
jgi:hypothetical protein